RSTVRAGTADEKPNEIVGVLGNAEHEPASAGRLDPSHSPGPALYTNCAGSDGPVARVADLQSERARLRQPPGDARVIQIRDPGGARPGQDRVWARKLVDRHAAVEEDRPQPRQAGAKQRGLALLALLAETGVRQHDEADAHAPEPIAVGRRRQGPLVEELVLRHVDLPVPAPRDWDPCAGKPVRLPVIER